MTTNPGLPYHMQIKHMHTLFAQEEEAAEGMTEEKIDVKAESGWEDSEFQVLEDYSAINKSGK